MKRIMAILVLFGLGLTFGAAAAAAIPAYIEKAVSDSARPATDTSRDANRHPAELLAFAGIKPGMKVVDLLPGGGYFSRIFARAVGPTGHVYSYVSSANDARIKARGGDPDNQLANLKAVYSNLTVLHGPLTAFATPQPVDLVWTSDNYHDLHNGPTAAADLPAINKAIFAALKPGGIFMVIDHRAAKGAGPGVTSTLHRMDEDIAKKEIEAAGFHLVAESSILANPSDDLSKKVFGPGEHDRTDQFVLKFQKPER